MKPFFGFTISDMKNFGTDVLLGVDQKTQTKFLKNPGSLDFGLSHFSQEIWPHLHLPLTKKKS